MSGIIRIAAVVSLCAVWGYAQPGSQSSWNSVTAIAAGQKIRVETANKKLNGSFVGASDDTLRFRTRRDGELSVAKSDVKRVYAQSRSRRLRNTVIGAAAGVAVGAILYGTIGQLFRNEGGESGGFVALPIAVGTITGAAWPAHRMVLVYDAPTKSGGSHQPPVPR